MTAAAIRLAAGSRKGKAAAACAVALHVISPLHVLLIVVSVAVVLVCRGTPVMVQVGVGFSRSDVNLGAFPVRAKNET